MADELSEDHPDVTAYPEDFGYRARDMLSKFTDSELDIDGQIDILENLISDSNPEQLLELISIGIIISTHLSTLPVENDGIGIPPRLAEYVTGKTISEGSYGDNDLEYVEISKAAASVGQAYTFSPLRDIDFDDLSEEDQIQKDLQRDLRLREVTSSRFMYQKQSDEAARRAYSPHNQYLVEVNGFTIEQAIRFTHYILDVYNSILNHIIEAADIDLTDAIQTDDSMNSLLKEFDESGEVPKPAERAEIGRDANIIEDFYQDIADHKQLLWMNHDFLVENLPDSYDESAFESFLCRMSCDLYDDSWSFREIDDFNPVHKNPIIKNNGSYLVPHPPALRRSLVETYYYDLINLEGYGDPSGDTGGEFGDKWGEYVEEWAHDSLMMTFPEEAIHANPEYLTEEGKWEEATDMLVLYKGYLLIFECKSKKLVLETRSGSFDPAREDLEDGIGAATDQALNFVRTLDEQGSIEMRTDGERWVLDSGDVKMNFLSVILGEQYDSVGVHRYNDVLDLSRTPYVVSVYDLQIICDLLSPLKTIGYMSQRISINKSGKMNSMDEIDLLGLYVDRDFEFPDVPEDAFLQVMDYSREIAERLNFKYGP